MHFRRPKADAERSRRLDDAILPLTNVVFLLLIFFMLAGQLATPSAFAVQPPQSISQAPAGDHGLQIEIGSDGRLALGGTPIDQDTLVADVERQLKARPGAVVILRADGAISSNRVVALMRRLHAAGAQQLRLVTISASAR